MKSREAQNVIQWNLMMADKEAEITLLTDQIESLNRALALDQKELDLLAESEEGLLELSRNINLTTQQVKTCVTCGDSVSSRLENISCQLSSLTTVVLGMNDDTYQAGLGHPNHLTDFREKSVMRELDDDVDDGDYDEADDASDGYDGRDDDDSIENDVDADANILGSRSTSIMIERNSEDQIMNIFRRDNSSSPDAIYSRESDTCPQKSVTREMIHVSTQTDDVDNTCKMCLVSERKLTELCSKLEEAKIRNDEQMTEISLLSRRVDQLQHQRCKESSVKIPSGQSSFIIKDLQMQVQQLEEKNVKKDALIKKLAEVIIKTPGVSVYNIVDTLTSWTVKPSDRRIDFDVQTLTSFLEKRKTSLSDPTPPSKSLMRDQTPVTDLVPSFSERIKSRI